MGARSDLGVMPSLSAHAYELRTLGVVDLRKSDGRDVRALCTQPKRLTLLIYLALAGPGCFRRRDRVAALYWPEADTEHARASLRQALRVLRRELGDAAICVRGEEEIGVSADVVWCDAVGFAAAIDAGDDERACQLFRGEFLDGLFVADAAPELEEWIAAERDTCRRGALAALGRLADRARDEGRHPEALAWAQRAAALDPLSEATVQRLIALHDAAGDRAGAVQAYEALAERMERELGVKPAPETQTLVSSIRAREIPVSWPEAAGASKGPAAGVPPSAEEREAEAGTGARRTTVITWLVLAASVITAVALAYLRGGGDQPLRPRVAVVPFENRTGNQGHDPIGRMAADWISQGLTQTGLVDVVTAPPAETTPSSVAAAQVGGAERLRRVVEATAATVLVAGAYYQSGDSIGLQAQVVEAGSGRVLRAVGPISIAATKPVEGIDRLRERLMGAFAVLLDARFREWARVTPTVPTYDAYGQFVDGVDAYRRADWEAALKHLRQATVIDPSFTLARLWLAEAHMNAADNLHPSFAAPIDSLFALPRALRDALPPLDRAVLDFRLAQRRGDRAGGLEAARRAATLWPDRYAFNAGMYSMLNSRPREAAQWLGRVNAEHGFVSGWETYWSTLGSAQHWLGDYRRELADARRARKRLPNDVRMVALEAQARIALGQVSPALRMVDSAVGSELAYGDVQDALQATNTAATELAAHGYPAEAKAVAASAVDRAVTRLGREPPDSADPAAEAYLRSVLLDVAYRAERWAQAGAMADSILGLDPGNFNALRRLASLAARRGDRAEAERVIGIIAAPKTPSVLAYMEPPNVTLAQSWLAGGAVAAILGDRDEAVRLVGRALAHGAGWSFDLLHWEKDFEPLRDYPPFQALLRLKE